MSSLTLFVYGEIEDLHMDFARTENDEDAKYYLVECVSAISHTLSEEKVCLGIHFPITNAEFDEWEETGEWNERVSELLIKRMKNFKRDTAEVIPFDTNEYEELAA